MGSGPWMFEEWVKDDHITMKANPDYFLGAPQIETLIYRTVPDRNTRLAMLETGEVDMADGLAPEDVTFIESNDDLRLVTTQSTGKVHVQIPFNVPRYADKRVRQALAMAVDTESIRVNILGGLAGPRLTVPTTGDYWVNPDVAPVQYDPEAAKQLLEEAGFPMEEQITLYASQGQFTKNEDIAAAIASNFRELGLNCQHQVLERSVAAERTRNKDFGDLYLSVLLAAAMVRTI
jgi:peptide/nickel transport system substrate-binding protein